MIKGCFDPLLAVVTALTILSLLALVNIITAVAAYAGRRRLAEGMLAVMALCAGQICVLAFKTKIGVIVDKGGRIELHESRVPPLMFRVTQSTLPACDAGCLAVKAFLVQQIPANGFMALGAELLFLGAFSLTMAFFAVVFVLCVCLAQGAGAEH